MGLSYLTGTRKKKNKALLLRLIRWEVFDSCANRMLVESEIFFVFTFVLFFFLVGLAVWMRMPHFIGAGVFFFSFSMSLTRAFFQPLRILLPRQELQEQVCGE